MLESLPWQELAEDFAIGHGRDTEPGPSHSRRRDFSAEGVPGKLRFRK